MAAAATIPIAESQRDFDDLYAVAYQGLTLQLYAYLGDLSEAQDVVQEAFCRAYSKWKTISGYQEPAAWVRRVAWNLATSRFRKQKVAATFWRKQRVEHLEGPSPDRVALTRALAKIPAQQRRAVVLHYMAQLSIVEIAEQEGVAEGTVKSWLSRGRAALGQQLQDRKAKGRNDV
ncbi:RNA polymerase sigma factor [Allorhizocola rhizosphaerae]|uniref:RNA polymerase sigma factor n=1 Tax=Allorhizocola rhizosphaerae TaxID=1872709 RepID=UPI000E3D4858|nr:SigE family RNA polymerase sigma factor [Allorhizocola rhizosphaerae]